MRTAAKLAGFSAAAASGIRGVILAPPAEQSVRNVSRPVSAVVSLSQKAKAAEVAPLHTAASWDLEDWDTEAGEGMARVVFGGAPSFQEAKAATTELKDAIDMIYLKSNSSECEGSSPGSQVSVVSPFNTELETKSCAIEAISNPSVPKHAFQAFQFLSASPEAQNVVASIACDPNVWNAVMQNPVVKDFFQSQQKDCAGVSDFEVEGTHDSENGFADFTGMLPNLKLTITEMVSSVSNWLQNIFGFSTAEESDGSENTKTNSMNHLPKRGTLMGLAVLVVMVVVLKRA